MGGRIIQRHDELRDLEAELIRLICNGVETEPVLQEVTGKKLNGGADTAPNARLDIVARDSGRGTGRLSLMSVCHPNAESYRGLDPDQYSGSKKQRSASALAVC